MRIAVLIKQVPSSEARIRITADGRGIEPGDVEFVVNPYDEYAMEAALQLKDKFGAEVVTVSLGPPRIHEALRTSLALGADRAVALDDPALFGADAGGVARMLAAAVRKLEADLVLCGKLSIDEENSSVGVQVAELLGWPHVSVVSKLEFADERHARVEREIEGGVEQIDVDCPAVLTANKGLNEPRYPSLKGIMMAKKKPLESWDAAALGLDASAVGAAAARVRIVALEPPPPRPAGQLVTGDAKEMVTKVVAALKNDRKLI